MSTQERGHQVNPRAGTPSQPMEKGDETPCQPMQKGRGHQVNPQRQGRGHQVNPWRKGGDTKSTHGKVTGCINWLIERGRLEGKCRAPNLLKAKEKEWRSSIVYRYKRRKTIDLYTEKRPYLAKPCITTGAWSQLPVPDLGLLLSMGATSHWPDACSIRLMRAVSPQTPPKPPGQIWCQHICGHLILASLGPIFVVCLYSY